MIGSSPLPESAGCSTVFLLALQTWHVQLYGVIEWYQWYIYIYQYIEPPSGKNRSIDEGSVYFPFHGSSPAVVLSNVAGHDPPVRAQAGRCTQVFTDSCRFHEQIQLLGVPRVFFSRPGFCRFGGSEHLHTFARNVRPNITGITAAGPSPSCSSWPMIPWRFRNNIPWIAAGDGQAWPTFSLLMGLDFDRPKRSERSSTNSFSHGLPWMV